MATTQLTSRRRAEALPKTIDFYSIGTATLREETPASIADSSFDSLQTLGFTIQGDMAGAMLCFFDRHQDPSVCAELGNVIASQLVTELSRTDGFDLMISPPRSISENTFFRLARASAERTARTYEWKTSETNTKFVVWLIWGQGV